VDQTPGLATKQNIYLLWLDHRRYLSMAENMVRHRLAQSVLSHAIIWRRSFCIADRHRRFDAPRKLANCLTGLANGASYLALLSDGLDAMDALHVASRTHYFYRLIYGISYNFHIFT
jgi:hypothetical protein